jgi:hypothetical protein
MTDLGSGQAEPAWLPSYWERLETSGWVAEMQPEERATIRERLAQLEDQADAYLQLASGCFDTECVDEPGAYRQVFELLAGVSGGGFAPENIIDEHDEAAQRVRVGFDLAGRHFEVSVKLQNDWFQEEAFELVNQALEATGAERRFLPLPVLDQVVFVAFVRPATFERALELNVLPSISEIVEELEIELLGDRAALEALVESKRAARKQKAGMKKAAKAGKKKAGKKKAAKAGKKKAAKAGKKKAPKAGKKKAPKAGKKKAPKVGKKKAAKAGKKKAKRR